MGSKHQKGRGGFNQNLGGGWGSWVQSESWRWLGKQRMMAKNGLWELLVRHMPAALDFPYLLLLPLSSFELKLKFCVFAI